MEKKSVVIVAGGKGLRMGTDVPKQFLPVKGIPVLMRTIDAFFDYDNSIEVVLVLPHEHKIVMCQQKRIEWAETCNIVLSKP